MHLLYFVCTCVCVLAARIMHHSARQLSAVGAPCQSSGAGEQTEQEEEDNGSGTRRGHGCVVWVAGCVCNRGSRRGRCAVLWRETFVVCIMAKVK